MWLIEQNTFARLEAAYAAGHKVTADEVSAVSSPKLNISADGQTANIDIQGVLTDRPDFMARIFGGGNTTYADIINQVAAAEADPSVSDITLNIDSPGGQATALWQASMNVIANATKPVRAVVGGMAASAAFGIAAQADEITAINEMSVVGSIGVVATVHHNPDVIAITSTNAPNKRPDPTTVAGQAVIREEIDAVEGQFIDMIARGRGVSADTVRSDFGRGGTVLAADAVKRGMIDSVIVQGNAVKKDDKPKAIGAGHNTGVHSMDMAQLRAEHPTLHAEAVALGVTQEHERVQAHMTLGEAYGAMDLAAEAIKTGKPCGNLEQAQYLAKGANVVQLNKRAAGDDVAALALAAATAAGAEGDDFEDKIGTLVFASAGMGDD